MTPRAALTKHLLDGDDSFLTGNFDKPSEKPVSDVPPNGRHLGHRQGPPRRREPPASTPFDADAT